MSSPVNIKDIAARLALAVLILFMLTIVLRVFTVNIIVQKFGIRNTMIETILSGINIEKLSPKQSDSSEKEIAIDWENLYPFYQEKAAYADGFVQQELSAVDLISKSVDTMMETIDNYTNDFLLGYDQWVFLENQYIKQIGWNISSYGGYNSVIDLGDGYLAVYAAYRDISNDVASMTNLEVFCQKNETPLLFVLIPGKVSKYEDLSISGTIDFSNKNADLFLQGLDSNHISYIDIRESIEESGRLYRDLFYKTDHHWKAETGFWAAGIIAEKLHSDFSFSIDSSIFDMENYRLEVYQDWFLGSQGKKVTLARSTPEDISLLYPLFETSIRINIPSLKLDATGDFSVLYDMSQISERDYFHQNPYAAYCYADKPFISIQNNHSPSDKNMLIIKDSNVNSVSPFLALAFSSIDIIDLRYFTGSLESYMKQAKHDIVIVAYSVNSLGIVDETPHTGFYDFR